MSTYMKTIDRTENVIYESILKTYTCHLFSTRVEENREITPLFG